MTTVEDGPHRGPRGGRPALAALNSYDILDTVPEAAYDGIVRLATRLCCTPVGLVVSSPPTVSGSRHA